MCVFVFSLYSNLSSESPDDFTALSSTLLTFDECVKRRCVNIPIVDDMLDEMTESFSITLHRTAALDNRITLGLVDGVIEIIDND